MTTQSTEAARTMAATAESTRDRILAVATDLFAREGYHAVGMRAIGNAAGIRAATLYNYFPSKTQILYAISIRVTRDFVDSHIGLLDGKGSRSLRLVRLLREHIRYFWEQREGVGVLLRELRALEADDREEVQGIRRRYQNRIREFIAAGVLEGEFDVRDVKVATLAILDMINGIVVRDWFKPGRPLSIDELADLYADLAVRGLLRSESLPASQPKSVARRPRRKERRK